MALFVFSTVSFYTINNDYTQYTVNGERFAGLNICDFSPMKFFMEMLSWCLGQQCLLFNYSLFMGKLSRYS